MKFRKGNPPPAVLRIEVTADTVEHSWRVLKALKMQIAYDPAVPH